MIGWVLSREWRKELAWNKENVKEEKKTKIYEKWRGREN